MRFTFIVVCLGVFLSLILPACQPPDKPIDDSSTSNAGRPTPFLFTGNPGIFTNSVTNLTGTLTGTIGGQPIAFGPDKSIPLQVTQGYDLYTHKASYLMIWAQNEQYHVSLGFNGPYEVGHSYRIYDPINPQVDKFDPYIVMALIRPPVGATTKEIIDLIKPDKLVRITAITDEYIDIEFLFTLDKPGAVQERINLRVKNVLNENRTLRTQSENDPFWSYTNVDRTVEAWGYSLQAPPVTGYPTPPTTTRVRIAQRILTTPVSDITYGGQTEPAYSQWISLTQPKSSPQQTTVEYAMGTSWSTTGSKAVEITWPNFTGVGVYTGDKVGISFSNDQGNAGYWRIRPGKLATATTKWLVHVQRVTAELIEGTYTIVDAPLYEQKGVAASSALESVSGSFKVIYPR